MTKHRIAAREFVADLRKGLDDAALMKKYELSEIGLGRVFDKLIEADLLSLDELWKRSMLSDSQITKAFVEAQSAIDELD
jgi:hypothetical protein